MYFIIMTAGRSRSPTSERDAPHESAAHSVTEVLVGLPQKASGGVRGNAVRSRESSGIFGIAASSGVKRLGLSAGNAIDAISATQINEACYGQAPCGWAGRAQQAIEALVRRQQGTGTIEYAGPLHNQRPLQSLGRYQDAIQKLNAALAIKMTPTTTSCVPTLPLLQTWAAAFGDET